MRRKKFRRKLAIHHRLLRKLRRFVRKLTTKVQKVEQEQLPPLIVEPGEPQPGGEYEN